ncbi:MAG TPA: phosphomethylpyrimidine synthase ThiC [Spirochaetota bacterium]|nr:phosphomethylpyrimidine synthase ThiC [Spirochaetota bacterium]HPL15350.1 phosphomethylpyrimidine synthase ThiC [Spirochaetota bacterium]HQF07219.1 phosphomethylpyrimidine synthase ThiC [Spirochaetota bacterium]HQH96119.1 phosphomethylpyrimidine synthase ThiC [Spirochaetota bacterium]HQJ69295.1 phosphomethylpyrimidine synthase ThiC [Spirochaetota bacterium]
MTQLEQAKKGIITPEMRSVAEREPLSAEEIRNDIAAGKTVITKSGLHDCVPVGIGRGLKIKINANIGTSGYNNDPAMELEKLAASVRYGADTVMDLSTGGDIRAMRKKIVAESRVPVGTVPVYEAIVRCPDVAGLNEDDFLDSIRTHIEDGVDFITVHCGVTRKCVPLLDSRIMGVVSRGGSFLIKWMLHHDRENPLFTRYDEILDMAREHDVTLSLGDGLRPGCLADASDRAQYEELKTLGELAARARAKDVQVMIEGPGHVPLHLIKENIEMQKKYCDGAPFYVLGPLVTDCSPGYDHLTGAIGGALAAFYGADFLCYLTPKEHLGLPDIQDVIDGVVASKIAAHAADIARGIPGARDRDDAMSRARSNLDWESMYRISMNPEKARAVRKETGNDEADVCTMCGDFCSAKINRECRTQYHK